MRPAAGAGFVGEAEAYALLQRTGFQPPRHALVGDSLPFAPGEPVVLKGLGENLWHKSELGAVKFMPPSVAYPVFELQPSRFPLRGPGSPGSPAIRGGHR